MTPDPITPEELQRIQAAAGDAANNKRPRCRCAGTCDTCVWWRAIDELLSPPSVARLCAEVRRLLERVAELEAR